MRQLKWKFELHKIETGERVEKWDAIIYGTNETTAMQRAKFEYAHQMEYYNARPVLIGRA